VIYLVPQKPEPRSPRVSVNIILFVLTVLSVMLVGAQPVGDMPSDPIGQFWFMAQSMLSGWPYALSLMSILLAHEFGHYLMSRHHRTRATLPYFIPLPLPPLGTMGAAIIMQARRKGSESF
jgi:membrane-associated protease RseP (regulator of RpoE activity)